MSTGIAGRTKQWWESDTPRQTTPVDVDYDVTGHTPFYRVREAPVESPSTPASQIPAADSPPAAAIEIQGETQLRTLIRSVVDESVSTAIERQLTKTPPLVAGVHTSRRPKPQGFSLLRVIGAMVGRYNQRSAAYELDILAKYSQACIELGWKPAGDATGFAFPNSDYLHTEELRPLVTEIRSAMIGYTSGVEPEELYKLRSLMPGWYTRDLSPLDASAGGTLIPLAAQGDMIELLRAKAVIMRAGANVVPMPAHGSTRYPRQSGAATAYRVGVGATITESQQTTDWVTLTAKKLGALIDMPNEFFRFASPGIETFVRNDLASVIALKIDQDVLEGAADSVGIKGLTNYPMSVADTTTAAKIQLIEASTTGVNGDTVQFADGDKMLTALEEAKSNAEVAVFIMRPTKRRNIFARRADAVTAADAAGAFLGIPYINKRQRVWYDAPIHVTTQITNNREKGSGTNLTPIFCGDFTDYLLAMMGMVEITWNPYDSTLFAQDATRVRAIQQCDGAPRHNESFAFMDDLLPTT